MPAPPPTGPLATRDTLGPGLGELGARPGWTLFVRSSPSSLGRVADGPVAGVERLLDAVGPEGTPMVPVQSGDLFDPARWRDPPAPEARWETVRATTPGYAPYAAGSKPPRHGCSRWRTRWRTAAVAGAAPAPYKRVPATPRYESPGTYLDS
ncbi:AAC(3) family N-acetyltransferase [Streptomyces sp. GD-15H]|uniref:AAC(3) family N-acetyltransferase n=1 Tax=Streptomyces sp. GD-15H TaxID=3129112 RepID=UPI003872E6AD